MDEIRNGVPDNLPLLLCNYLPLKCGAAHCLWVLGHNKTQTMPLVDQCLGCVAGGAIDMMGVCNWLSVGGLCAFCHPCQPLTLLGVT